ncbi:hypothetical protein C0Q70_08473 [Pomacea canaliculata]|uniref:Reverse transcriptase domain-containing protein n=1 Tax=Pomacea canaliculata TaxID=400727 RepID=A0A2T7PHX6_POMCA|nr:hypothetical protein C0Q70_08473 [Pomacea canaliculata]
MQEKANAFSETAGNLGLKVSTKKTKSMRVNARVQDSIKLNGEEIEEVDSFTYLGSKMSNTGDAEVEMRARLLKASQAFASLRSTWKATKLQSEDQAENIPVSCDQHPPLRIRIMEDDQNHL